MTDFIPPGALSKEGVSGPVSAQKALTTPNSGSSLRTLAVSKLPSKGLPYKLGTTIHYRPYDLGELSRFEIEDLSPEEKLAISLSGVSLSTGESVETLTLADAFFMALMRNLSTLGSAKATCQDVCPVCKTVHSTVIDTSAIEVSDLNVPSLPVSMETHQGVKLSFAPLTVASYFKLTSEFDKLNNVPWLRTLAQCCTNMEPEAAYAAILAIESKADLAALVKINQILDHHCAPIPVECKAPLIPLEELKDGVEQTFCETTFFIRPELEGPLFHPFREDGDNWETPITFG